MRLTRNALALSIAFLVFGLMPTFAQIRLSAEEADKLVITKPKPVYSQLAKMMKLQEKVEVEVIVTEKGVVSSAVIITGSPVLKSSALAAVKNRRYKPLVVDGKPVSFVTVIAVDFSLGIPEVEYKRDKRIGREFFAEEDRCRALVRVGKYKEAEPVCVAAARLADEFGAGRELEKMGAYELVGHVMLNQSRFREALDSYSHALAAVGSRLDETDAELGRLYGGIAIAHHRLRDLDKAREMYRKAVRVYHQAYAEMGKDDPDEWAEQTRREYMSSLKKLIEYHMVAAEQSGVTGEVEELKRLAASLPR